MKSLGKTGLFFYYLLVAISLLLLVFMIFKNIAYPLFWNDEGETVALASSVLKFGYPKIHDGKNVLNLSEEQDKSLGVKEERDAYIHVGWLQFYFTAPFVYLTDKVDDFYLKTAIIRIPFATLAFLGIVIFSAFLSSLIQKQKQRLLFFLFFLIIESFSIFLLLQVRVARMHSLVLFLSLVVLAIYLGFRLRGKYQSLYYFLLPVLLILIFNALAIYFFVLIFFIGILEVLHFYKEKRIKPFLPLFVSLVISIPLIKYFEIFRISQAYSQYLNFGLTAYVSNLSKILLFFSKYEHLGLILFLRLTSLLVWKRVGRKLPISERRLFTASNLLSLFFIFYSLAVSRIPFVFERYFLLLQPILVSILLLDTFFIFFQVKTRSIKQLFISLTFSGFLLMNVLKIDLIGGYFYELFHPYKGPLDYVIPYIKQNYQDTQNLVIATNYEENVYMYYLESKVTVGFVGNNLEEDSKIQPDIIIPRKGRSNYLKVLEGFLSKADYKKKAFPIYDYQYNNIPELSLPLPHLFKTRFAANEGEKLEIYIKQ